MIGSRRGGMEKKGYFFTLDAFIAASIFAIGLIVIFSSQVYSKETAQEIILADSAMKALGYTQVDEVDSGYIHGMIEDSSITNLDNTLLEQAGEFYFREQLNPGEGWIDKATGVIEDTLVTGIPPKEFGIDVRIEGEVIMSRGSHDSFEPKVLASSKRIISSIDLSEKVLWGPYKAEVNVWRS